MIKELIIQLNSDVIRVRIMISFQKIEKKLYEILGVRFFRVLVFKLEKAIHHRDKRKNTNYHIANYEPSSLDAFIKYLFYNGAIHARNILYFAIYVLFRLIWGQELDWFDVIMFVFAVKDIYCVMLQRYNYIRINERKKRLEEKRKSRLQKKFDRLQNPFCDQYDTNFAVEDLEVIRAMKQKIAKGGSIVISDREQKTLQRIVDALQTKREDV